MYQRVQPHRLPPLRPLESAKIGAIQIRKNGQSNAVGRPVAVAQRVSVRVGNRYCDAVAPAVDDLLIFLVCLS